MKLEHNINGRVVRGDAHPGELLVDYLRRSGYWSVKRGCQDGNCGTCVVTVNGQAQNACLMMAHQTAGAELQTCEGLGTPRSPHPIQEAFVEMAAVQCGFCTPGLIMSTKALLDQHPNPTEEQVREFLDGNLCRCTGYTKIFEAVTLAAERLGSEEAQA